MFLKKIQVENILKIPSSSKNIILIKIYFLFGTSKICIYVNNSFLFLFVVLAAAAVNL